MRTSVVKSQHYITEKLLRHFADADNKLVEVLLGNKKIYPTTTNNSMCESFIYEDDHLKRNTVENYFARIESNVVPKINDLIWLIESYKVGDIEFDQIRESVEALLPIFLIFYYRSGALLTEFSSIKKTDKIPLLSSKILNRDYINALTDTLCKYYKFAVIESDTGFLISDQYMSTTALKIKSRFFQISNRHIGLKDTLILIPVSSRYYLAYWNTSNSFIFSENSINSLNDKETKEINTAIINNSYIKCVGKSQEIIEGVLGEYHWASPTHIYAGWPSGLIAGAINKKELFFWKEDRDAFEMIQHTTFIQYKDLGRNDLCACGSGKKFKKCHESAYLKCKTVLTTLGRKGRGELHDSMVIPGVRCLELPIDQWSGYSKKNK